MAVIINLPQRREAAAAKAAQMLPKVDYYVVNRETVIIASATTVGRMYVVTSTGCTCKAGVEEIPCWHQEARLNILHPRPKAKPQTDAEYARTLAACDELC
ncbi:MAG: hypothetical protein M3R24_37780 [Chloroflexota bacterium]|nr:hypothetical protein [Chloroflexota bacterium]